MKKLLSLLGLAMVLLTSFGAQSAVTQTNFRLKYNTTLCRYEVYIIIKAGSASYAAASSEIVAYPGLVTIVVDSSIPNSSLLSTTISSYYPQGSGDGGQTLDGAGTAGWIRQSGNVQKGSSTFGLNGYKAFAFSAPSSGAYWPDLNPNDTFMLFSFVIPGVKCGSGVRLWNNNQIQAGPGAPFNPAGDPVSTQWNNKDFNNGYNFYSVSAGVPVQTYTGNASGTTTLPVPTITPFSLVISGGNITASSAITSGPSSCASLQSYTWTQTLPPTSTYTSTTAVSGSSATATLSRPLTASNLGTYALTVTNGNGCTTSASNSIVLPIKLISFKGTSNKCAAQLGWEIAHGEKDFQGFDLQYSSDGATFATIGHVERNPYNDVYSYSYTQASGKGFYRLKITDLSGMIGYSETAVVTTNCDNAEITIAPNPTQALSTVSGIESGDQVKVTDMLGNVIANYVSGGSRATIDLGIFPSGIYSVMISRGNEMLKTAKITKL